MSTKLSKIELLAPAGDFKKMQYAFAFGADAVYLGLPSFSLRAKTDFDMKSLKTAVDYAHQLNKKVYVTINVFAHNRHLRILPDHLKQLNKIKPDAIIISDPGVMMLVKKHIPKVPIFISTQANVINSEAVKFWHTQGVKRIILGREASLTDIEEIHRAVPKMELEVFVHGAMCMSYSGRCYLSSWLNGRSANEGLCTQPCRWNYKVYLEEPLRPGQMIPVEADSQGTYIMNSKDLCLIDYVEDLMRAGVVSFKIEGRTKSIYYLAVVTKAYRQAIDLVMKSSNHKIIKSEIDKLKKEFNKIDNRGYTTGFLLGSEKNSQQNFKTSKGVCDWQFVGEVVKVLDYKKDKVLNEVFIKVHNVVETKDKVEIITPKQCYNIKMPVLYNDQGEKMVEAHGGTDKVYSLLLPKKYEITPRSVIRKNIKIKNKKS